MRRETRRGEGTKVRSRVQPYTIVPEPLQQVPSAPYMVQKLSRVHIKDVLRHIKIFITLASDIFNFLMQAGAKADDSRYTLLRDRMERFVVNCWTTGGEHGLPEDVTRTWCTCWVSLPDPFMRVCSPGSDERGCKESTTHLVHSQRSRSPALPTSLN